MSASRISSKIERKIRVFQSKSYIGIDLSDSNIDFFKINNDKDGFIEHIKPNFQKEDALENELSHFIDCIINKQTPLVSVDDGIRALEVAIKIEELINEGIK